MTEATAADRTDPSCYCPLSGVVETLAGKYAMQLVCVIGALEPVRFSTVEEHLPDASTSTLSARLDELAEEGLVTRTQYDEIPPRVEYALTDDGRELCERLEPVLAWAEARDGGSA
ncbi:winged helix-turn-helix transcriptional regulator [Halostella litorea]|uniref:winged helix-turn-helix transcriptional regulator n=1 Tax=Halostella litorea TaxID=2528831 RepID=UPI001091EB62|nr:helix-turn-helix domain-containing protein [Halostella litorea]